MAENADLVLRDEQLDDSGVRGGLGGFDVAVISDGLPGTDVVEMCGSLGVTWILATGSVSYLHDLLASRRSVHA